MASGTKPLLFIHPLTPSLIKLKEVIQKTAEEDGVEIFDIDDAAEANQLIPTVGQSLTLCGNPKKCAQVLQATKKAVKKLNSKVILLSTKPIKRATLDKFQKVGLTECIVEPVPPKTLLYKVNLILRSIKGISDDEDSEQEIKSLGEGETEEEIDASEKRRIEKGLLEEDGEDLYGKGNFKKREEEEEVQEREKKKSNYKEEAIGTHWSGENKEKEELEDDEDETSKLKNDDDNIESYYKGKSEKSLDVEEEDELKAKKSTEIDDEEDIYEDAEAKKRIALELEEDDDIYKKREEEESDSHMTGKLSKQLDIEDDEKEAELEKEDLENDDKYLKGKVSKQLDIEEEDEDYKEKREVEEEEQDDGKKDLKLDDIEIEEDDGKKDLDLELDDDEEYGEEKEIRKDLEVEAEELEGPEADDEEEDDIEDKKEKNKAEEIEKYYKGDLKKEDDEEDDEDDEGIKKEKREFTDFDAEIENDKNNEHDDDDDEYTDEKENKKGLGLEDDTEGRNREKFSEEDESNIHYQKQGTQLDLEDDDKDRDLDDDDDHEEDDFSRKKKNGLDLEVDDSNRDREFHAEDDESGEFGRKKLDKNLEDEESYKKKAKLREDDLGGNYSSVKSLKHEEEYDWDIENERRHQELEEERKKNQADINMVLSKHKDLGEQTINYAKLWDEFGGITVEREADKEKKTGPKYYSDDEKKKLGKGYYGDDDQNENSELGEQEEEDEDDSGKPLYEPEINGLDTAVSVLSRYYKKDSKIEDILSFISERIYKEEGGVTAFISQDPNTSEYQDLYIGHLHLEEDLTQEEREEAWTKLRKSKLATWRGLQLPNWSDLTFQNKDIEFFYPFYEGVSDMGMAIVHFKDGLQEEKAKKIEIILETARGLYLEKYHEFGDQADYSNKKTEVTKAPGKLSKVKGFFGKLLG
jgi:hypothetical protein